MAKLMFSFNWIVVAKCQASKNEPEFERIVAGFDLYTNAVDFVNMFPEEIESTWRSDRDKKEDKTMNELFKNEIQEAENKLSRKGYYVANMTECNSDKFEVYNENCEVVMDYLTVSQLIQLANLL